MKTPQDLEIILFSIGFLLTATFVIVTIWEFKKMHENPEKYIKDSE